MAITPISSTLGSGSSGKKTNFSHTELAGSARLLVVTVGISSVSVGVTVSYGGDSLSFVGEQDHASAALSVWWFYKVSPLLGSNTVGVTVTTAGTSVVAVASSWTGVDQVGPIGTLVGNEGSTTTPTVAITSATDEVVIDSVALDGTASLAVGGGQTLLKSGTVGTPNIRAGSSHEAGAASVTMSWTAGSSSDWCIAGCPIKPATIAAAGAIMQPGKMWGSP